MHRCPHTPAPVASITGCPSPVVCNHANAMSLFTKWRILALSSAQCSHTAPIPQLFLIGTATHSGPAPYLTLHHTRPEDTLTCFPHSSSCLSHLIPHVHKKQIFYFHRLTPPPAGVRVCKALPASPCINFSFHRTCSRGAQEP